MMSSLPNPTEEQSEQAKTLSEVARKQQDMYDKLSKTSTGDTNQEWGHQACAFIGDKDKCRSLGRCNWKPLSYWQ